MKIKHKHHYRITILYVFILFGVILYLYYGIYKNVFMYSHMIGGDFKHGYDTAIRYLNNQPIYFNLGDDRPPFLYSPLALIIFLPFVSLGAHQAVFLWFIICHAMVLISAWLLYRIGSTINKGISACVTIAVIGFCTPLYVAIYYGNINIIILTAFCFIFYSLFQDRKNFAPCLLAACTYLKIFPALYMIVFLRKRSWKLLSYFIICLFLFGLMSVFIFTFENNINYIKNIIPSGMKWSGIVPAMSLSFFVKLHTSIHSETNLFIMNGLFGFLLLTVWWFRGANITDVNIFSCEMLVDLLILPVIAIMIFPASWLQYHLYFIVTFYFVLFFKLQYKVHFKYFILFIFLFAAINFWQPVLYHFPLTRDGVTMVDILYEKQNFPILYPVTYSLPFIFNILLYVWLILNYKILLQSMKCLKCSSNRVIYD